MMEKKLAYLISLGIVAFGCWIVAAGQASTRGPLIWVAGMVAVAVGLASLINEVRNSRPE
jgi:hypothetical protein